jgi:hypothetical protein
MKADKATVQARIEDIARVILDGAMPFQIGPYLSAQEQAGEPPWKLAEGAKPLSSRHIRRLVRRAEALIAEAARTNRKRLLQRHLAQRRALYARAVQSGDVRAALACARDEAELLGLYPSKKTEVTGKGGGPAVLNIVEELTGRDPPAALDGITEEVVTHDGSTSTAADGSPPSRSASLPPQ